MKKTKTYEIDMTGGSLFDKILLFALPLMASGILQLLFNAVDIAVVGRFTSSQALAAVGATTSLINVYVNLFIGISLGTSVVAGRYFATGDEKGMSEAVHTAITTALAAGLLILLIGTTTSKFALLRMGTPAEILPQSLLYIRLYFCSMPFFMVYNYGAAILRSVGDTRRPLVYLTISGLSNVVLNLVLVILFHMGVAGVAIGTILAQMISASLVIRCLMRVEGAYRFIPAKMHINRKILTMMLRIGVPAGLQSMLINVSNVIIQSTVNTFGTTVIAGNTAATNLNGFLYMAINAVTQAGMNFTSQNTAVRNFKRNDRIVMECTILEILIGSGMGIGFYLAGHQLLGLYTTERAVVNFGMVNLTYIGLPYALCGIMDMLPGCVRGMGYSLAPMLIALTGVVLFRFFWVFIVFPLQPTMENLYLSYPISWIFSIVMHLICFFVVRKKVRTA